MTDQGNGKDDDDGKLDRFELCMALMLGLGAIGGAWAGFQSDLWGGIQAENYGLSSKEMARAASTMSLAAAKMGEASASVTQATSGVSQILAVHNHNTDLDVQAKQHLFEGIVAREIAKAEAANSPAEVAINPAPEDATPVETTKHFYVAKYLFAVQMDEEYYLAMGFPPEFRGPEKFETMPDDVLELHGTKNLPAEVVEKALEAPAAAVAAAGKAYEEVLAAQADAAKTQAEADTTFQKGSTANTNGDNLGFTGVLFTVALFLAGIGLVFKSRVRWGFAAVGGVALVGATIHLFMQNWTSLG